MSAEINMAATLFRHRAGTTSHKDLTESATSQNRQTRPKTLLICDMRPSIAHYLSEVHHSQSIQLEYRGAGPTRMSDSIMKSTNRKIIAVLPERAMAG